MDIAKGCTAITKANIRQVCSRIHFFFSPPPDLKLCLVKLYYMPRIREKGIIFSYHTARHHLQSRTELLWYSMLCTESIVLQMED